jgi:hypothetical protein
MFGTYSGGQLKRTLTADDLAGVQAIYGLKATPPGGSGDPASGLEVAAGANLLTWPGPNVSAVVALSADKEALRIVYGWEASTETWTQFGPMLPGYANTLSTLRQGSAYWFIANKALVIPFSP